MASVFGIPAGVELGMLGAQVAMLGAMVAILAGEAGVLGTMFSGQGRRSDPNSWSYTNLEKFRQPVVAVVAGFAAFFAVVAGFAAFFTVIFIRVLAVMSALPALGFSTTWGLQLGSALGLLGSLTFGIIAAGAINQEEAVMGYNPATS
jgi:hypothetical protein